MVADDPVGNGRSSRVTDGSRYTDAELVADAVAVLDATGTPSCVKVGLSKGGGLAVHLAALHPDRIDGAVAISAAHRWGVPRDDREFVSTNRPHVDEPGGWELFDAGADVVDAMFANADDLNLENTDEHASRTLARKTVASDALVATCASRSRRAAASATRRAASWSGCIATSTAARSTRCRERSRPNSPGGSRWG